MRRKHEPHPHVQAHFREFGFRKHTTVHYEHGSQFEHDVWHPQAPPDHELADWQDWFTAHGIDPTEVLLTHWVERRTINENKIVYLEDGIRDGHVITVERVVELNEPPLPFPDTDEGREALAQWRANRAVEGP